MTNQYNTIIVTCDRGENNYLATTVAKLVEQEISPIYVQQGSNSHENLHDYGQPGDMPIETLYTLNVGYLRECRVEGFDKLDIRHRHNRNYAAAFLLGDMEKDALILEDDVVPCKNLQEQLKAVYWLIEQQKLSRYIIALYSFNKWPLSAQSLNNYPLERFFGLQAMLYSANLRQIFHDAHYGELCDKEPADFITRIVAKEQKMPIYATTFSLFQHVGKVTTGLGNFHETANFLDGTN